MASFMNSAVKTFQSPSSQAVATVSLTSTDSLRSRDFPSQSLPTNLISPYNRNAVTVCRGTNNFSPVPKRRLKLDGETCLVYALRCNIGCCLPYSSNYTFKLNFGKTSRASNCINFNILESQHLSFSIRVIIQICRNFNFKI